MNIKDVAKACGLSTYTVSSVLNNKGDISEETSKKVWQIVHQLNYNPIKNLPSANNLITKSVALILPDIYSFVSQFYSRAIGSALNAAKSLDYDFKILTESDIYSYLLSSSTRTPHLGFDIAIFFCPHLNHDKNFSILQKRGILTALIRRTTTVKSVLTLNNNDILGIQLSLQHLYDNGHRVIAFAASFIRDSDRHNGYREFLVQKGLTSNPKLIIDLQHKDHEKQVLDIVKISKATAIACNGDILAAAVIKILLKAGIKVPEQVAVTGYDNDPIGEMFYPEITTVDVPVEEMVEFACKMLCNSSVKTNLSSPSVEFPNKLIVRDSSGNR